MRAITYLVVRFSLRDRIHSYLADQQNNEKIRRLIWAFLHAPPPLKRRSDSELYWSLQDKMKKGLGATSFTPGLLQAILQKNLRTSSLTRILLIFV